MNIYSYCKSCRYCNTFGYNCKGCVTSIEFDIDIGLVTEMIPSNWKPMTEAQKLEREFMERPTGLSGNINTGYTYKTVEKMEDECMRYLENAKKTNYGYYKKMFKNDSPRQKALERIKKVIFNDPCTIVLWNDGTKTVVKCGEDDVFDPEKGLAMAISKYFFDNAGYYNDVFKKWMPKKEETDEKPIVVVHSVKELAELLGCSVDIIRKDIKKGYYPGARKEHGRWMIPYEF